jgi:RNA polymerase sigma-70 factor (TIGR02960 family)
MTDVPLSHALELKKAIDGDEGAFARLVSPHRRPLFRHCYRMLGSGLDAEDAVQETLLRAWRRLDTLEAAGTLGGWLYRIATNVCLDQLRSRSARVEATTIGPPSGEGTVPGAPDLELRWVEPIRTRDPDDSHDPLDQAIEQEDITLAFVAALQRLAPRQRACLLLHDVLGFSQPEVAEALDITPSGVNSLLHRARQSARPRGDGPLVTARDPRMHDLVHRYVEAWRLADMGAFMELVADDIRLSMPPLSEWFDGAPAVAAFIEHAIFAAVRPYGVSLRPGWCNGQPAFATYEPGAGDSLVAGGLQVLEVRERDGRAVVTDIVSYRDPELAVRCGFPASIP